MRKYLMLEATHQGPVIRERSTLDAFASLLMAFHSAGISDKTASAWKRVGKQWVPCWPYQLKD